MLFLKNICAVGRPCGLRHGTGREPVKCFLFFQLMNSFYFKYNMFENGENFTSINA